MDALRDTAQAWLAAGRAAVLVQVSDARGSVPREAGTRMLVSADEAAGTIGGGHLEWQAIAHARAMLGADTAPPQSIHYPLGPSLGQCCGGAVTLSFERLQAAQVAAWPQESPRFHLQLYGAGHVGRAIARLLAALPVRVDWIDERDDAFPATLHDGAWPAHIRKLAIDAVEDEVRHAPVGAFYLVLTHQHDLDLRITEAILHRNDFGFFGLIGSKTKKQRFIHRLQEKGVSPAAIERMVCPIGVPGIAGKEPEVIAVGVVAQLLRQSSPASA